MLQPKAWYEENSFSAIYTQLSGFLFPRKLLHAFSNASQSLLSAKIN
jgi:hypothetical protein